MAKTVVGLDVGSRSVRAVEVSNPRSARPSVGRFAEFPLSGSVTSAGDVTDQAGLASALKQLWRNGKFSSKNVMLGIGGVRVFARDVELPQMSPQQLKQSLQYHVQDLLPMPASDAVMDFVPLRDGTGPAGPVVTGLLVAAPKSSVMALVNSARLAGLNPIGVDLVAFAVARVQSRAVAAHGSVAFVDIGAGTTSVAIASEGVPVFIRMVPLGGDDVTRALMRRLDLSESAAETAKRATGFRQVPAGATPEQTTTGETINQVAGELLTSIRTTVQYYTSNNLGAPITSIVLSGGGARLDGLALGLREYTRLDVAFVDPSSTFDQNGPVRNSRPQDWEPMTVALGLALGGSK